MVPGENESSPHTIQHLLKAEGCEAERFDLVVSNADIHHTYSKIYQSDPVAKRRRRKLERMQWSMSLFVMYFGTRRRYSDIAHHTILFGPRFKGLLKDIFTLFYTTKGKDGNGVGLSMAKKFVESMGGKISVISHVGVGSVFGLAFPQSAGTPDK